MNKNKNGGRGNTDSQNCTDDAKFLKLNEHVDKTWRHLPTLRKI